MSGTDDPALSPTADGSGQAALAVTEGASSGGVSVGVFVPVGTVIDGQYRVDKELGRGGMGAVVLAHDLRLERDVAVKLGTVVSAGALQRVEREAIALAKLQHPNVVVVHQVGKFEGRLYIAMEHVAGGNATQWLAAKPRTWRDIALLYAAAADGLAAAHAAGFIHRDFKPDNVLVGEDDRPRVADFGLVRSTTDSIDPEVSLSSSPASPRTRAPISSRSARPCGRRCSAHGRIRARRRRKSRRRSPPRRSTFPKGRAACRAGSSRRCAAGCRGIRTRAGRRSRR